MNIELRQGTGGNDTKRTFCWTSITSWEPGVMLVPFVGEMMVARWAKTESAKEARRKMLFMGG